MEGRTVAVWVERHVGVGPKPAAIVAAIAAFADDEDGVVPAFEAVQQAGQTLRPAVPSTRQEIHSIKRGTQDVLALQNLLLFAWRCLPYDAKVASYPGLSLLEAEGLRS